MHNAARREQGAANTTVGKAELQTQETQLCIPYCIVKVKLWSSLLMHTVKSLQCAVELQQAIFSTGEEPIQLYRLPRGGCLIKAN